MVGKYFVCASRGWGWGFVVVRGCAGLCVQVCETEVSFGCLPLDLNLVPNETGCGSIPFWS